MSDNPYKSQGQTVATEPLLQTDAAIYWQDTIVTYSPITGGVNVEHRLTRVEREQPDQENDVTTAL